MRGSTRPRNPVITTAEWFTTRLYPEAAVDPVPVDVSRTSANVSETIVEDEPAEDETDA
jgi:hypothetical protein